MTAFVTRRAHLLKPGDRIGTPGYGSSEIVEIDLTRNDYVSLELAGKKRPITYALDDVVWVES